MKNKFEIINPEEEIKKNFRIEGGQKIQKHFEIQDGEVSQKSREGGFWLKQRNDYDCGPCLLLNSAHILGFHLPHQSIEQIRNAINAERRNDRTREQLSRTGWLTATDLGDYLHNYCGMTGVNYALLGENVIENIFSEINNSFDLMVLTVGRHFRGVVPAQRRDRFLVLDSMRDGPEEITRESLNSLIQHSYESSSGERKENIGVYRR